MRGVLYENIHVDTAYLFPVWVGPPYQELRGACPLLWPFVPPQEAPPPPPPPCPPPQISGRVCPWTRGSARISP